ncbi:30S ribosomal protein S9 [Nymphaea thermarum]|nr:30S ribosomal protein S9 [Nymphaea thermarum]
MDRSTSGHEKEKEEEEGVAGLASFTAGGFSVLAAHAKEIHRNENFIINDKQFDVYFPILDYRADLLKPFAETKTLGMWDVKCTVKGGGSSGNMLKGHSAKGRLGTH